MNPEKIIDFIKNNLINTNSKQDLDIEQRCLRYYLDDSDLEDLEDFEPYSDLFDFKLSFSMIDLSINDDESIGEIFYHVFESVDNYIDMRNKAIDSKYQKNLNKFFQDSSELKKINESFYGINNNSSIDDIKLKEKNLVKKIYGSINYYNE